MALPKRRQSSARGKRRRTHWKLSTPALAKCENCSQARLSHHICTHCGFYSGRQVIDQQES